jgi:hypothetical protein
MISYLIESFDRPGDDGIVDDTVYLIGVLWIRVFSGDDIMDDFIGIDISSVIYDFLAFFFTLNRSILDSKIIRSRIILNLSISISKVI